MIEEIYWQCAECGDGVSEYEDIYFEQKGEHYCRDCAKDAGIYKCHFCGMVYDILENKSTCPECGREKI